MQVTYCARIKSILSENAVHAMIICAFIDQEPLHEKPVPTLSICLSDAYYGQRIAAAHIQRIPIQRPEERISIWLRDSIGVKYVISYVKSFDSSSNAYGAHVNGISPTYCSAAFSTNKWLILRTKSKDEKGHCLVDETIVHVIKREFCPEFNYRIDNVFLSLPLSWIILPV